MGVPYRHVEAAVPPKLDRVLRRTRSSRAARLRHGVRDRAGAISVAIAFITSPVQPVARRLSAGAELRASRVWPRPSLDQSSHCFGRNEGTFHLSDIKTNARQMNHVVATAANKLRMFTHPAIASSLRSVRSRGNSSSRR